MTALAETDGVVAAYLLRGGLRADRLRRCQELSGGYYMFDTFEDEHLNETGICLYSDRKKYEEMKMTMDKLREYTATAHEQFFVEELES
ncbi:hypothetical protein VE03_10664 [Pseudogymnoascus sp. 23342-1-I1]|nr:hypothetical protein VE03_10664 [Pseudogymnoascus sp. 23342-1-I1]